MIPGAALLMDTEDTFRVQRSVILSSGWMYGTTDATANARKKWTMSLWIKRNTLGERGIYQGSQGGTTPRTMIYFDSTDHLVIYNETSLGIGSSFVSTPTYTATTWKHFVIVCDTTQAVASDRVKVYVDNSLQSWGTIGSTAWAQNDDTQLNMASSWRYFGVSTPPSGFTNLGGYASEFYLIDNQTLTPSSFAAINPKTSTWSPIRYTGTYGTKSWYINFSNPSSTSTVGYDYSGRNNNLTGLGGISMPADSSTDVPA